MELIIFSLITIVATIAIVWILKIILDTYYNIKALRRSSNVTDETKKRSVIVYNKKSKKLEADEAIILPF